MLGLKIVVERGSGVPLFKQLIDQLRTAIMRGGDFLGTRLPSERELSKLLRLNRSVVVKAYNELKMDGLLDSRSRSGTYVISVRPEQQCHFVGRSSTILCKSTFRKHDTS